MRENAKGITQAIFPVMPRGVEHATPNSEAIAILQAIFPVMPRGVEHLRESVKVEPGEVAIFPVMPRGVEHFGGDYEKALGGCDFSGDAARR